MSRWYYAQNKQKLGPVTIDELKILLASRQIQTTDMVLQEGTQKWVAASSVPTQSEGTPSTRRNSASEIPSTVQSDDSGCSFGARLIQEVREICVATVTLAVRLVEYACGIWRGNSLKKAARAADLALGQSLYETGHGEPGLRSRIAALDADFRSTGTANSPAKALKAQQAALFLQLADSLPKNGSPPAGVEAHYARAKNARAATENQKSVQTAARARLWPSGVAAWRRLAIGYGAASCLVVFVLALLLGGRNVPQGVNDPHAQVADTSQGRPLDGFPGDQPHKSSFADLFKQRDRILQQTKRQAEPHLKRTKNGITLDQLERAIQEGPLGTDETKKAVSFLIRMLKDKGVLAVDKGRAAKILVKIGSDAIPALLEATEVDGAGDVAKATLRQIRQLAQSPTTLRPKSDHGIDETLSTSPRHSYVTDVSFTADGKRLASSGREGEIKFWDARDGRLLSSIEKPSRSSLTLVSAAFSPDAARVLAGYTIHNPMGSFDSVQHTFVAWDAAAQKPVLEDKLHKAEFSPFSASPDGKTFATSDRNSSCKLRLWQLDGDRVRLLRELTQDRNTIDAIAFSPDGKLVATASPFHLWLWRVDSGEKVGDAAGLTRKGGYGITYGYGIGSRSLCFAPDGQTIAYGIADGNYKGESGTIVIYSLPKLALVRRVGPVVGRIDCMAYVNQTTLVVGGHVDGKRNGQDGYSDGVVALVDLSRGLNATFLHKKSTGGANNVTCLALAPDKSKMVFGDSEGFLRLVNIDGELAKLEDTSGQVHKAEIVAIKKIKDLPPAVVITPDEEKRILKLAQSLNVKAATEGTPVQFGNLRQLSRLGPKAKASVPSLIQALELNRGFSAIEELIAQTLGDIGPAAKDAVPALAKLLENEQDRVRSEAATALGRIGPDAKDAVPALAEALKIRPDEVIQHRTATYSAVVVALARVGPEAKKAVPALAEALKNTIQYRLPQLGGARLDILKLLVELGPESKAAIPALISGLKHEERETRSLAAEALGKIGANAKDAVPALLEAILDDAEVRLKAAAALKKIDPAAAGKAGLK